MTRQQSIFRLVLIGSMSLGLGTAVAAPIAEFLDNHCIDCHDSATEKGGLDLEPLFDASLAPDVRAEFLAKLRDKVERQEMPPADKIDEGFHEKDSTKAFLAATHNQLLAYFEEKKKTGLGGIRRLKREEYVNTVQDLLHYPLPNIAAQLPEDDPASLHAAAVTDFHLRRQIRAAEEALDYVIGRKAKGETTLRIDAENRGGLNYWLRYRDNLQVHPEKGILTLGNRVSPFSGEAELTAGKVRQAGLYRVRVKVIGHRADAAFRVAVRSSSPTSGQQPGIMGTRPVHFGTAKNSVPTEVELKCHLGPGDQLVVQKTSNTRGPGRYQFYKHDNPEHSGMWITEIEVSGPDQGEIESVRRALLGDAPPNREGAKQLLDRLLPRAFRAPIDSAAAAHFLAIYDRGFARSGEHLHALREALKGVLTSPQFLYRNSGTGTLDDYEIAARLSYFLWGAMPDAELFALASKGALQDPATRAAQAERLLADARSGHFVRRFTDYWLNLHRVGETKPGFRTKPAYNAALEEDIRTETRLFFQEILKGDLPVTDFLHADWTMLNENLAILYGLEKRGIEGAEFRRVDLELGDRRGGLLAQSSFACLTSNGTETQPILRGVWVLQNLLGEKLEPPKNVEPIETDSRGAKSMLDQIRLHRDAAACQSCHQKIDPLGIALENYGVIGNWREKYRSKLPIVISVEEYSDLSGPAGVKALLEERQEEFTAHLINKLKEYALGREITYYDLHRSRLTAEKTGSGLKTLIQAIVADESFLVR